MRYKERTTVNKNVRAVRKADKIRSVRRIEKMNKTQKRRASDTVFGSIIYWVAIAAMFYILFMSLKVTVWADTADTKHLKLAQQADMEETILIRDIKTICELNGYKNCGVTLTKTFENEGIWEYTILIHHGLLEGCCEAKYTDLMTQLEGIKCGVTNCVLRYEFI